MDRYRSDEHLRNIQAVTDTALGRLDVEDLLIELLDRVRGMLNADTAAVLLLEEGTQELVARAARGIEEEVYQGVRVPVRMVFAGRIAAEGARLPWTHRRTTVANPILWEKGIGSCSACRSWPRTGSSGCCTWALQARRFTAEEAELLRTGGRPGGLRHPGPPARDRAGRRPSARTQSAAPSLPAVPV